MLEAHVALVNRLHAGPTCAGRDERGKRDSGDHGPAKTQRGLARARGEATALIQKPAEHGTCFPRQCLQAQATLERTRHVRGFSRAM